MFLMIRLQCERGKFAASCYIPSLALAIDFSLRHRTESSKCLAERD